MGWFRLKIRPSKKARKTLRMVPQLTARLTALRRVVPSVVAHAVLEHVTSAIPAQSEWKAYRDGLRVSKVVGLSRRESVFSVHLSARAASGKQVNVRDAAATLVYVRPVRRLARLSETTKILERYNPWTMDMLPITPPAREAKLVARRVSRQVAARASRRLRRTRVVWAAALQSAGDSRVRKAPRVRSSTSKPREDPLYPALALELGVGRIAKPHWRPAISPFTRMPGHAILEANPDLEKFIDPSFRAWRRWGPKTRGTISKATAKRFLPFQTKLGLQR